MVGPESGTRYLSSTHVMPRDVSQSQISVPSESIARNWYPPPGNTTTATPVLRPSGAYLVIVGTLTSLARGHQSRSGGGPSDSGFGSGSGSGTAPGQMGICVW